MKTVRTTDGSLTLESPEVGESYRSRHGALSESRHVFLEPSGVLELLAAGNDATVLEIGFGTGLNFLATACAALEVDADAAPTLHYRALEHEPPPLAAVSGLDYRSLLAPCELPDRLLAWLKDLGEPPAAGSHRFLHGGSTSIELELLLADARTFESGNERYDAVYLDPFSPKSNPDLWTAAFLASLAAALKRGGRLVTYSVSGEVRRALAGAGLLVSKVPGPAGGKREVLVARRAESG